MMLKIFSNEDSMNSGDIYRDTILSTRSLFSEEVRQKAISEIISRYKGTDETIPPLQILENLLLSCNEIYDEQTFKQLTTQVLSIFLKKYNNKNMATIKKDINSILPVCITHSLAPKKRYDKCLIKTKIVQLVAKDLKSCPTSTKEVGQQVNTGIK